MTMIKGIDLEDKTVIYELKLEPHDAGRNFTISNDANHLTQINGSAYLFEERGDKANLFSEDYSKLSRIVEKIASVYFNKNLVCKFRKNKDISIEIRGAK